MISRAYYKNELPEMTPEARAILKYDLMRLFSDFHDAKEYEKCDFLRERIEEIKIFETESRG